MKFVSPFDRCDNHIDHRAQIGISFAEHNSCLTYLPYKLPEDTHLYK